MYIIMALLRIAVAALFTQILFNIRRETQTINKDVPIKRLSWISEGDILFMLNRYPKQIWTISQSDAPFFRNF